jgi:hypothetical protein
LFSNPYDDGDDSIFDDFFGGPAKKPVEKKQEAPVVNADKNDGLVVDDSRVLEFTTLRAS